MIAKDSLVESSFRISSVLADTVLKEIEVKWNYFEEIAYANFEIDELAPNTTYLLNLEKKAEVSPIFTFKTEPFHRDTLRLLFGGCAMKGFGLTRLLRPSKEFPIYHSMAKEQADAMLWTGDNLYYIFEAKSDRKQIRKNILTKSVPDLQHFLSSMPQYAIWDDHDYGPDNSDGSFKFKHLSFKNFNNFWANPNPVDSSQGIYYAIEYPQADFFMMDNRFQAKSKVNYLGKQQMEWLKASLLSSKKPFKFIVTGIQAGNPLATQENLRQTGEWDEMTAFIKENKITGVLFLNGDRHHSEIFKHEMPDTYPFYEFTCSPLTSIIIPVKEKSPEFENPSRIRGVLQQYNYGRITISPEVSGYKCTLEAVDENGTTVWGINIHESELRFD